MERPTDLKAWAGLLKASRRYFDDAGFVEVMTDHIVPAGAFEACLDVFDVTDQGQLHTSPEIEMKVLLSDNPISIYQICRCFRDDPITEVHAKEFTMLEFYEVGAGYLQIRERMKSYLSELRPDLALSEVSFEELLETRSGLRLEMSEDQLRSKCEERGLSLSDSDRWSDIVMKAWVQKVEPQLPMGPVLVMDYPAQFAALSELSDETGRAQRFEIYWDQIEICNGCVELRDKAELQSRIKTEAKERGRLQKPVHPIPERLSTALESLPPCAGVAVGLERLYRCLND